LGRSVPALQDRRGTVPAVYIGGNRLPVALQGGGGNVVSINDRQPFRLDLGTDRGRQQARRRLLEDLAGGGLQDDLLREVRDLARSCGVRVPEGRADDGDLLQFVQRRQLQTYTTLDRLQEVLGGPDADQRARQAENEELQARFSGRGRFAT